MTNPAPPVDDARVTPLPCPFCGGACGEPATYGSNQDARSRFVSCMKCGANIYRHRETQEIADAALINDWNARAPDPTRAALEECVRAMEQARNHLTVTGDAHGCKSEIDAAIATARNALQGE